MMTLFTFCNIPWWLSWLLPFLLGLALGWLLWSRFRSLFDQSQAELSASQRKLVELQVDFDNLKKQNSLLDGDLALCRGRLRELEASGKSGSGAKLVSSISPPVQSSVSAGDRWALAIGLDQFQVIEGIGPKMEEILKENNILTFSHLAKSTPTALREILNKYGDKYRIIDPGTWPQQARLVEEAKYQDLIQLQKSLDGGRTDSPASDTDSKLEKFLMKAGFIKKWKQDDLKAIEGIGPKIALLLQAEGITTWQALSETDISFLQTVLAKAGPRFQLADPSTWAKQAKLAAEGKWDELQAYQDALTGGKES